MLGTATGSPLHEFGKISCNRYYHLVRDWRYSHHVMKTSASAHAASIITSWCTHFDDWRIVKSYEIWHLFRFLLLQWCRMLFNLNFYVRLFKIGKLNNLCCKCRAGCEQCTQLSQGERSVQMHSFRAYKMILFSLYTKVLINYLSVTSLFNIHFKRSESLASDLCNYA